MSVQVICDLCGKPLSASSGHHEEWLAWGARWTRSERRQWSRLGSTPTKHVDSVDVHNTCVAKIFDARDKA